MSDSTNQMILNFLDRTIDENIKHAQELTSLKGIISEQRSEIKSLSIEFQNKIKYILDKIDETNKEQLDLIRKLSAQLETDDEKSERKLLYKKIDNFIEKLKSPKVWFSALAAILVAIATLVGSIATIIHRWPEPAPLKINNEIKTQEIEKPKF